MFIIILLLPRPKRSTTLWSLDRIVMAPEGPLGTNTQSHSGITTGEAAAHPGLAKQSRRKSEAIPLEQVWQGQ